MKIKFILFSLLLYFLHYHPLIALLQIDPASDVIINSDGTPAQANSIQNVLGVDSGYKIDSKTSKISKADGTAIDPAVVRDLIDTNITNVIQNSVAKLNLYYDQTTGNVYDADGVQIVSPQLDIVNNAVNNSLNDFLTSTPDVTFKDKQGDIMMKAVEWGAVSTVGIFLAYYGVKSLRSLYSENWRDLRKAQMKKALAKLKDRLNSTDETKEELKKATDDLKVQKEKNDQIKENTKTIKRLESRNKSNFIKEKWSLMKAEVAGAVGAKKIAEQSKKDAEKAKETRNKNKDIIITSKFEKTMREQGHTVQPLKENTEERYEVRLKIPQNRVAENKY